MRSEQCKRPHDLRNRQQSSERNRAAVLQAAKRILKRQGYLHFTMANVAKESSLTRQTVHNLFGAKLDLIEALFDQLAENAAMANMRLIMQLSDPVAMVRGYLRLMIGLWSKDRVLIRRIHGLRAVDPEFDAALNRRDRRRKAALEKIVDALEKKRSSSFTPPDRQYCLAILSVFTSFEAYEQLSEGLESDSSVTNAALAALSHALSLHRLTEP